MRPITTLIFFFCIVHSLIFGEEWNTVYLASFPRSGNHWVRFLVEEATHIATSSVYRDKNFPHLRTIFPWGGYCTDHGYEGHCRYSTPDDPILLKTHYPFLPKNVEPIPKRTICLIRHPIDAFWSFKVFREGNKSSQNSSKKRKKDTHIEKKVLEELIQRWRMFYEFWMEQPGVVFIRYEDLQTDTPFYLNLILQTAGYSFTQTDVERAVNKYFPQGIPLKHICHYDAESLEMIQTQLSDILARFNYEI